METHQSIYLCGGINGLSDSECNDWRTICKKTLSHKFIILDPMRRDYRGREKTSVNEIVTGDYNDIAKSDIILVNATRASWGTAMEMHHAFTNLQKYVIAVTGEIISPWVIYHSHKLFDNLDEPIALLMGKDF